MFGGTPANLGITFLETGRVEVVTGVNLPMLIKLAGLARHVERARRGAPDPGARTQRHLGRLGPAERRSRRIEHVIREDVTIVNALGLHARAAARFVQLAGRFRSKVRVSRDGRQVDGKSIMGILLLAAAQGAVITISADGIDEADALQSLAALVRTGFGEDTWSA